MSKVSLIQVVDYVVYCEESHNSSSLIHDYQSFQTQNNLKNLPPEKPQVLSFASTLEDDKQRSLSTKNKLSGLLTLDTLQQQQINFLQDVNSAYQLKQLKENDFFSNKKQQRQLLFKAQVPSKSNLVSNTYFPQEESSGGTQYEPIYDSKDCLESEVVHLQIDNEYSTTNEDELQVTQTSLIDWDDQQRIEFLLKKQKSIEDRKGFDLCQYFDGLNIIDLETEIRDQRLSDMFKNEMEMYLKESTVNTKPQQLMSQSKIDSHQQDQKLFSPPQKSSQSSMKEERQIKHNKVKQAIQSCIKKVQSSNINKTSSSLKQTVNQSSQSRAKVAASCYGQQTKTQQVFDYKKSVQNIKSINDQKNNCSRTLSNAKIKSSKSVKKINSSDLQVDLKLTKKSVIQSPSEEIQIHSTINGHNSPIRSLTAMLFNSIPQQNQYQSLKLKTGVVHLKSTSPDANKIEKQTLSNQKTQSSPQVQMTTAVSKYKKSSSQLASKLDLNLRKNNYSASTVKIQSFHSNASIVDSKIVTIKENKITFNPHNKSQSRINSQTRSNQRPLNIQTNKSVGSNLLMQLLNSPQQEAKPKSPLGVSLYQNTARDKIDQPNTINKAMFEALVLNKTSMLKKTISDMSIDQDENTFLKNLKQEHQQSLKVNLSEKLNIKSPQAQEKSQCKKSAQKAKPVQAYIQPNKISTFTSSLNSKYKLKNKCYSTIGVQKIL